MRMNNISLLIGSGFSKPMGYPIVKDLNKDILSLNQHNCFIDSVGQLHITPITEDDPNWYSIYYYEKLFFIESTKYYDKNVADFDYEKFYDFLYINRVDGKRDTEFQQFCDNFIAQHA